MSPELGPMPREATARALAAAEDRILHDPRIRIAVDGKGKNKFVAVFCSTCGTRLAVDHGHDELAAAQLALRNMDRVP